MGRALWNLFVSADNAFLGPAGGRVILPAHRSIFCPEATFRFRYFMPIIQIRRKETEGMTSDGQRILAASPRLRACVESVVGTSSW